MNSGDLIPALLLILFSVSFSACALVVAAVIRSAVGKQPALHPCPLTHTCEFRRPSCWLAIKCRNVVSVQSALGLQNVKRCSWSQGLAGQEKVFIAPPVKGWILVIGSGLPDPGEDIDACFRFLVGLSRKIGHVQFFTASSVLHHHSWVKLQGGKVTRAYAWAGRTLWHQGGLTLAEKVLDLKCFDYSAPGDVAAENEPEAVAANVKRVPLLAAHWSLDPAHIDGSFVEREVGVSGELSCRF